MQSLAGKTALIAGGAGEVGEGIVKAFLEAEARVIVPSRSEEKLARLRERFEAGPQLITIEANLGTVEGAEELRAHIEDQFGTLHAVVASLGGWWQGLPLVDIDLDLWHKLINNSLTAHFIVAKTFLPFIADEPSSSYTLINGGGGLHPVPTAGPVSVSAAGQIMFKDVLAAEMKEHPVRINTLLLATPILTRSRPEGQPDWLTAYQAGQYAVYLASDAATEQGETIIFEKREQLETLG